MTPLRRVLVLLNAAAGTLAGSASNDEADAITARFAARGVEADVRAIPGPDLERVAAEARDSGSFDLIIAGGGDGTLNTVAGVLVGSKTPFAVLPLGTFNHLAKELSMPLELDAAIDALVDGQTAPFNVGRVNGQPFLLFMSIGLYSDIIRHRDAQQKTRGRRKKWAGTIAIFIMLFRWPLRRVTLRDVDPPADVASLTRLTSSVYVSLSGYQMKQMGVMDAPADGRGALSVLVSPHVSRLGMVAVILKGLFGRLVAARDLQMFRCDGLALETHGRSTVRVGFDGEVRTMATPLRVEIVRGGLLMRAPGRA